MFVKISDFIKFKRFLVYSYRTGAPQKTKPPTKLPEKWTFLSLAFYNAPSLHAVNVHQVSPRIRNVFIPARMALLR